MWRQSVYEALCTDDKREKWAYLHSRSAYSFGASIVLSIFFYRRATRRRGDGIIVAWRPMTVAVVRDGEEKVFRFHAE